MFHFSEGGAGGNGGGGASKGAIYYAIIAMVIISNSVKPRFNEVLRDWRKLFVISRVSYIEQLDLTNFRKNNQNARYIEV